MDWKKFGRQLMFPPVWLLVILTATSAVLLLLVFIKGWENTVVAYAVYVAAFYTLCTLTAFCAVVLPKRLVELKRKAYENPWGNRYITDDGFRIRSNMYLSVCTNLVYIAMQLLFWYQNRSWWFAVLAGYYLILAFLWSLLAGYVRSHTLGSQLHREWKRARSCGYILLLINLSLSGAVLMILYRNKGYDYPGILIYVMALYTFYSAAHAIVEMVKHRRMESPVLAAAQTVSVSAALVSMLNLETAMFAQFGQDMAPEHRQIFIVLTGAGISLVVVTLAVRLIIKATKNIRREKNGE
ncbi:MAG: hypothetical protein IJO45_04580 [Oscillospiraceae bacterium]|nr:hypothetical protein [Oscillospiraceae bacterium]